MHAEFRRLATGLRQWLARLGEKNVVREIAEGDVFADSSFRIEKRVLTQFAKAEATAKSGCVAIAGNRALEAFGGDILCNVLIHFDEDESAAATVFFVHFENGVACCSAAS